MRPEYVASAPGTKGHVAKRGVNTNTQPTLDEKLDALTRRIDELGLLITSRQTPELKFCLTVEELSSRWALGPEAVRRLVRNKELRPLRGFRPFRFTMEEVRRYEAQTSSSARKGGR
jgi:hypothetical protein